MAVQQALQEGKRTAEVADAGVEQMTPGAELEQVVLHCRPRCVLKDRDRSVVALQLC